MTARKKSPKKWSKKVMQTSDALDLKVSNSLLFVGMNLWNNGGTLQLSLDLVPVKFAALGERELQFTSGHGSLGHFQFAGQRLGFGIRHNPCRHFPGLAV